MKNVLTSGLILVSIAALVTGLTACNSVSEEDTVRKWADPATKTYFEALDANDFDTYIKNGNDEFKAAVTSEILEQLSAQLKTQVGAFKSIEYKSYAEQEGYTHVVYTVKFEKMEVSTRMVFDSDHKIAGQWFE